MKCNIFFILLLGSLLMILKVKAKRRNVTITPDDADDVDFLPVPKQPVIFYPQPRIVGGSNAREGQFPYQVSLRLGGHHICGGSIISANYVVTAAHCLTTGSPPKAHAVSRLSIRAGSIEVNSGGQVVAVASIISHASYRNFNNDIAVLKLAKPLQLNDRVKTIALASQAPPAGAKVETSGWGRLHTSGPLPQTLQFTTFTALSNDQCRQRRGKSIPFTILCLDHPVGNGACNGDSGGPAVYQNQLVGVVSYRTGDCGSKYPDSYTNVASYFSWIKKNSDL